MIRFKAFWRQVWRALAHDWEDDPYLSEFAEAPKSGSEKGSVDREPRCALAPRVVADADLDRNRRPIEQVNADFSALLEAASELAALRDLDLSAYYVLPEGDR